MDGAFEVGCVTDIEIETLLSQQFAATGSFLTPFFSQIHIGPAGKEIEFVPFTFAMSDQY